MKARLSLILALAVVFFFCGCDFFQYPLGKHEGNSVTVPPADDDGDDDTTDVNPGDCSACHSEVAEVWMNYPSSHSVLYDCSFCHEKVLDTPGAGHRALPWCDSCHSEETHVPLTFPDDGYRIMTCMTCHDPHGSSNAYLIQEKILGADGELARINFQNTYGYAPASYAQQGSQEGKGLCEVCHEATKYYNNTGTGSAHYTSRCTDCHTHDVGFSSGL